MSTTTKRAEPQSFRGRALSVSLTVKDVEKSVAWYQHVVGFTVDEKHERNGNVVAVSLKAGDVSILVGQDDGAKGWDRVKGEGFSFRITTEQDVDAMAARITERGGTLDAPPSDTPWGARVFRLRDPDGFKIVISTLPPDVN